MSSNTLLAINIKDGQYKGNKNLAEVEIPEGVVSIGKKAFKNSSLKTLIMPDSVETIGKQIFCNCYGLENIRLSNSIKEIPTDAFAYCRGLKKLSIPESVEEINSMGVYGCENLEEVLLNVGLKKVGNFAFCKCRALERIVIPNSVTNMGIGAFEDCESLKEVILSDSIKEIGDSVFRKCRNLEKVLIPGYVTKIHRNAFKDCKKVVVHCYENSTVINQLKKRGISYKIIPDADDIKNENWNFTNISDPLEKYNALILNRNNLQKITIPEGIKLVGEKEFFGCENLEEVVIPASVKIIDTDAFANCKALKKLVVLNPHISIDESIFEENKAIRVHCPENSDFIDMLNNNSIKYEIIGKKEAVKEEPEFINKFTPPIIKAIKNMLQKGISMEMIAKEFGCDVEDIEALVN